MNYSTPQRVAPLDNSLYNQLRDYGGVNTGVGARGVEGSLLGSFVGWRLPAQIVSQHGGATLWSEHTALARLARDVANQRRLAVPSSGPCDDACWRCFHAQARFTLEADGVSRRVRRVFVRPGRAQRVQPAGHISPSDRTW